MLSSAAAALPGGEGWQFEPKWDGFRTLVFRDGDDILLQSRDERPMNRYFPELVAPLAAALPERCVVDGEIVIVGAHGLDFEALLLRIHPAASRVKLLAAQTPASFVAWDLLALGDQDLRDAPLAVRRQRLEQALAGAAAPVHLSPATRDRTLAEDWFRRFEGAGLDGVMAKRLDAPYRPGERTMIKVKHQRTADCVVGGFRWHKKDAGTMVGSLLLGLHDDAGVLRHVGVASGMGLARGLELLHDLEPYATDLAGHPWEHGFLLGGGALGRLKGAAGRWSPDMPLDWIPVAPARVCEVAYEQVDEGRLRHPARFRRWRPDREPASCLLDQLAAG
jgi:ATP-dependent DNA ligase